MTALLLAQNGSGTPSWMKGLFDQWPWMKGQVIEGVTVGGVIIAFVMILATLVVGKIAKWVIAGYAARLERLEKRTLLRLILRAMATPVNVAIVGSGLWVALVALLVNNETLAEYGGAIGAAVVYVAIGWFVYNLVDIAEHYLNKLVLRTETPLDDQLVPLVRKAMRVLIVIVVALFIAQNVFKANIGAMLAGLGIGGLAIALAAQDSIANFFGSITIFADQPFVIGDRIKIDGYDGMVEEVGFRSTKIRTLTGHLVTMPNSKLSNSAIENIGQRPFIRRYSDITITYDTPPEKIERAVEILKRILVETDNIRDDFWIAFNEFNDWSLNLNLCYKVDPPDWFLSLEVAQKVNLRMMREFEAEGIEFAFPTSTLYHKTEAPLFVRHVGSDGAMMSQGDAE
jgi:MscS family membrane protein